MDERIGYAELQKKEGEVKAEMARLEAEIGRLQADIKKKESEQKGLKSAMKKYKKCPGCGNLTHLDELKENGKMCSACKKKDDENSKEAKEIFNRY
jgi:acetyl-CoA carboxylase beta subunit